MGKSGRVLDHIFCRVTLPFEYLITNAINCRPVFITSMEPLEFIPKNREPTPEEIKLCRPKLEELYNKYQPDCVVYLGKVAAKAFPVKIPNIQLLHPAAIIRQEFPLHPVKEQAALLSEFYANFRDRTQSPHRH